MSVTILALGVLLLSVFHWVRLAQAVQLREFLTAILPVPPLYLALTGLVWGLAWLTAAAGLFWGRAWAPGLTRALALVFALAYWLDRMLLADPTAWRTSWPFQAGLTVLLLASAFWLTSRPWVREYFRRNYTSDGSQVGAQRDLE